VPFLLAETMTRKLISIGDSFTYGSDLVDENPGYNHSLLTWPALIADELGAEYVTYAWPGIGNKDIAARTIKALGENGPNNIYVINWTFIDRLDFYPASINGKPERYTMRPGNHNKHDTYYYKHLHGTMNDKQMSLMWILTTIKLLEDAGAQFVMTIMDRLLFEDNVDVSSDILYMQRIVKPYMHYFDGNTFLCWAMNNNYNISDFMHPLEDAHLAAHKLMLNTVAAKYHIEQEQI